MLEQAAGLLSLSIPAPFPWSGNFVLGIAKLLLPIVHVKRETPYVVSLAMTALMPDCGPDFHKKEGPSFKVTTLKGWKFLLTSGLAWMRSRAQAEETSWRAELFPEASRCSRHRKNWF